MTIYNEVEFNEMLINDIFKLIDINTPSYMIVFQIISVLFYVFIIINTPVIIFSIIIYDYFCVFTSSSFSPSNPRIS
jgi:hypothetical protein